MGKGVERGCGVGGGGSGERGGEGMWERGGGREESVERSVVGWQGCSGVVVVVV